MPNQTQSLVEKNLFLLIDANLITTKRASASTTHEQTTLNRDVLTESIFKPIKEHILAHQRAGSICTIRFLIIQNNGVTNVNEDEDENEYNFCDDHGVFHLKKTSLTFQPEHSDTHVQFLLQFTKWLEREHITTVTMSHFFTEAHECLSHKKVFLELKDCSADEILIAQTWIYIHLMRTFLNNTRTRTTTFDMEMHTFFSREALSLTLETFFNQHTLLIPKNTRIKLQNETSVLGKGSFLCTNIEESLPHFILHFPLKHPTAKPNDAIKILKDSQGVKQLNLIDISKAKQPRQIISDLVGKLSIAKNIPPFKRAETPNHKHPGRTNFSIRPNEWAFFSSHNDDLTRERNVKNDGCLYTIGNYAVSSWFRRPLETMSEDDDTNVSPMHEDIRTTGLDLLKQQLLPTTAKLLGTGSMGSVYEASWVPENSSDEILTAVKKEEQKDLCKLSRALNRSKNEKLLEHQLIMQCSHPSIVSYVASGEDEQHAFLIMELGGQFTLRTKLKNRNELLPQWFVLHLFVQICLAMDHLHGERIIHRDLKTKNIVYNEQYDLTIIDLGISVKNPHQEPLTTPFANEKVGTFHYMAPEVIAGRRYGSKADLWSMGVILYEMLELKRPFFNPDLHQLEQTICDPDVPMEKRNNRDTPEELSRLVERLLDKNPDTRISSVEEIFIHYPIMRRALVHFYNQFESRRLYQHDNNQEHKKHLFSIGMMRNQCDRIFKACQSYDLQLKENLMTDDGTSSMRP